MFLQLKTNHEQGQNPAQRYANRIPTLTLTLQNRVDVKTVSSMLGHYDAGLTLRTYTHATRQMQEQAAEKMGSFMEQVM